MSHASILPRSPIPGGEVRPALPPSTRTHRRNRSTDDVHNERMKATRVYRYRFAVLAVFCLVNLLIQTL